MGTSKDQQHTSTLFYQHCCEVKKWTMFSVRNVLLLLYYYRPSVQFKDILGDCSSDESGNDQWKLKQFRVKLKQHPKCQKADWRKLSFNSSQELVNPTFLTIYIFNLKIVYNVVCWLPTAYDTIYIKLMSQKKLVRASAKSDWINAWSKWNIQCYIKVIVIKKLLKHVPRLC